MKSVWLRGVVLTGVLTLLASTSSSTQAAFFLGLGDLPGGVSESHAFDISSDGSVVVGISESTSGREAYR